MPYRDDVEALESRCNSLEAQSSAITEELLEARRLLDEARRPVLDNVRVAAPCTADWEEMTGDERVRFCGQCCKNVYNLSGMTRREAETLLSREADLCIRFFRRADGTILTQDCPVGLKRRHRRNRLLKVALAAAGTVAAGAALDAACSAATTGKRACPTAGEHHTGKYATPLSLPPSSDTQPEK